MRHEAEAHAEEDRKRKEVIEARNIADNMVYQAEKLLRENGEKIPADTKKEVEESINSLKNIKESDDLDGIKRATDNLNQAVQKIGASMYQQPGAGTSGAGAGPTPEAGPEQPGGSEGGPASGPSGEDVVDGEFKNVP